MSRFSAFSNYSTGVATPYSPNVQTMRQPLIRPGQNPGVVGAEIIYDPAREPPGYDGSVQARRSSRLGLFDARMKEAIAAASSAPVENPHEQVLQQQVEEIREISKPKDKVADKMQQVTKAVKASGEKIKKSDIRELLKATNP